METMELANPQTAEMLEKVLVEGDLSAMTPQQRLDYYRQVCQSCGLNPLTKPFAYIKLGGKLTLYAQKDATDQLRRIYGVNIDDINVNEDGDWYIVTVKGSDRNGRKDVEIGAVAKKSMEGNLGNALMKAVTKGKRRLTLSLCGLGWLDETEVETIPKAEQVIVNDSGEIVEQKQTEPEFDEDAFLKSFTMPEGLPYIAPAKAENEVDSYGNRFGDIPTDNLAKRLLKITESLKKDKLSQEQRDDKLYKLSVICAVLENRAVKKGLK